MATKKNERFDFEGNIAKLEKLVEKMESGKLSLEDSLAEYEQGIKLIRDCQKALSNAEQKVQKLSEKAGEFVLEDMDNDED